MDGTNTENVNHVIYCKVNGMFGIQPITDKQVSAFSYVSTDNSVTPGAANGTATFTLTYQ